jgi:hypothetical protein
VDGLAFGKVGVDPETVSGLEIRNLGDREGCTCALDADFHSRADEIEGGVVGVGKSKGQSDGRA